MSAKNLYQKLLKYDGWVAGGDIEKWEVKNDDGSNATGSTITRYARKLEENNYIRVKHEGSKNHSHYKANKTKAEMEAYRKEKESLKKGTTTKQEKVLPSKPVPMRLGNEKPIAVPPEAVANLLAHGWKRV